MQERRVFVALVAVVGALGLGVMSGPVLTSRRLAAFAQPTAVEKVTPLAFEAPRASGREAPQPLPTLGRLDSRGTVTYFIDEGVSGSEYKPTDRQLAEWALDAWARSSDGALRFETAPEPEALVRVHWVPAAAGQYGEMRPMLVNGRRGAAVYVRPDTSALGPDIARMAREDPLLRDTIVYLTCLHELGHALGLAHTAAYGDIMYFFGYGGDIPGFFTRYRRVLRTRNDIGLVSGLSDADIRTLRALYEQPGDVAR